MICCGSCIHLMKHWLYTMKIWIWEENYCAIKWTRRKTNFFPFIHGLLILYVINFSDKISVICISIGYEKCFVCVEKEKFAIFFLIYTVFFTSEKRRMKMEWKYMLKKVKILNTQRNEYSVFYFSLFCFFFQKRRNVINGMENGQFIYK